MKIHPTIEKLVLHWGEMGARWGISRTVAQIHALLYFSPRPLTADEIVEALGVARSHVSNSLKELQSWGVVKGSYLLGDRREHFESIGDVWQMFEILLDERKRREIDPTLAMLRECIAEAEQSGDKNAHTKERLTALRDFFEVTTAWYMQVRRWPTSALVRFVKLGDKALKLLKLGR